MIAAPECPAPAEPTHKDDEIVQHGPLLIRIKGWDAMLACDGSKPSEVVSPSSGADSQQARLIKCLPTKAAELTIVAHGLLELLHVFFGKSTARQGKYDGVLPMNVAPIALEKAS